MRITLLTAASEEYWPLIQLSAPNKLEYCLKYKIQLSIRKHVEPIKSSWSVINEREYFMQDALKECDWLWFMGADTLIMNHNIDVRQFLDEDYNFIIGEDINDINNDVFFLKNNEKSEEFLIKTLENNKVEQNDQFSMIKAMKEVPGFKTKVVHQKQFNSFLYSEYSYRDSNGGDYEKGDFVLHLPGIPNTRRIEIMKQYLKLVDK